MLSWTTYFMAEELKKRGYEIETFESDFLARASKGNSKFFFYTSKNPTVKATTYLICKDKYITRQIMQRGGFASPGFVKINRDSIGNTNKLKFPLVIKPVDLFGGKDVVVGVNSLEEIENYFIQKPQHSEAIVEEMLRGEDARILIVRGKFFAATKRIPAFVQGDGEHKIIELVAKTNAKRAEMKAEDTKNQTYTNDLDLIVFDAESKALLSETGLSQDSIPEKGERVFVRKNANTSMGGVSVDVTDQVCQSIRSECERLAQVLDMTLAGIDIMTTDLTKPLNISEGSGIVEVNSSPGLDLQILTDEGQRRNPVPLIVDEIEEYLERQGK